MRAAGFHRLPARVRGRTTHAVLSVSCVTEQRPPRSHPNCCLLTAETAARAGTTGAQTVAGDVRDTATVAPTQPQNVTTSSPPYTTHHRQPAEPLAGQINQSRHIQPSSLHATRGTGRVRVLAARGGTATPATPPRTLHMHHNTAAPRDTAPRADSRCKDSPDRGSPPSPLRWRHQTPLRKGRLPGYGPRPRRFMRASASTCAASPSTPTAAVALSAASRSDTVVCPFSSAAGGRRSAFGARGRRRPRH